MKAETDTAPLAQSLELLLRELAAIHSSLLELASEHRAAISRADAVAIEACLGRQEVLLQRSRAADDRRRALLEEWSPRTRVTLSDLAARVREPSRGRLLALGAQVRLMVERLARENRTVRLATDSLMAHMDGLVRQVARRLSQSGTYSRRGGIDAGAPVAAGIDLSR